MDEALERDLRALCDQIVNDIDAIEREILPTGQRFADWSSVNNTRVWAQSLARRMDAAKEQG